VIELNRWIKNTKAEWGGCPRIARMIANKSTSRSFQTFMEGNEGNEGPGQKLKPELISLAATNSAA